MHVEKVTPGPGRPGTSQRMNRRKIEPCAAPVAPPPPETPPPPKFGIGAFDRRAERRRADNLWSPPA